MCVQDSTSVMQASAGRSEVAKCKLHGGTPECSPYQACPGTKAGTQSQPSLPSGVSPHTALPCTQIASAASQSPAVLLALQEPSWVDSPSLVQYLVPLQCTLLWVAVSHFQSKFAWLELETSAIWVWTSGLGFVSGTAYTGMI